MLNGNQSRYPKHYQKTDIFNLSPEVTPQRRAQVDRNKSSVFNNEAPVVVSPRKDRMASDIFFGGNTPQKFGGYEPSFLRQSAQQIRQEKSLLDAERVAEIEASELAAYEEQELMEPTTRQHEFDYRRYAEDREPTTYQEEQQQYDEEYYSQPVQEKYVESERLISNVFEDQQVHTRGTRRHFQSGQQNSDIFFQNEATPVRRYSQMGAESSSNYNPSPQSSSYSNIFGAGNAQNNFLIEKQVSNHEHDRVSGLSSEDLNRSKRGRSRRGVTTSQIFF